MVAIVTGSGLGLERSSAKVFAAVGQEGGELGSASFGRYGEDIYVNASNGNLMVDRTDEVLIGLGPDDVINRSYNSQSANQGYMTQHGWQINDSRKVFGLTGLTGNIGSTIKRSGPDGSVLTYTYSPSQGGYVCDDGGNGEYRINYDSTRAQWKWTDSKNNYSEYYDPTTGRLATVEDTSGNVLTYNYDPTSGLLTGVVTQDGETTTFTWGTGNRLLQISAFHSGPGGLIESRTSYTYDSSGRLKTVTTDLSPEDGTVGTDKVVTTYGYDGSSDRIASINQTGGAEVDFTYDGSNRITSFAVKSATGDFRTTNFDYSVSGHTKITDQDGNVTDLGYDSDGQLESTSYPAAVSGGASEVYSYTYDADGNLASVTDPESKETTYGYDGNDNLVSAEDPLGNTVAYTYDTHNHLTIKTTAGPVGQSATTRYAYDDDGRLTFAVGDVGDVTQYTYDSSGNRTSQIDYTDEGYDLSALTSADAVSNTEMRAWANDSARIRTTLSRIDYSYDFRGNLATETRYTATRSTNGNGVTNQATTKPYTVVTYTYDQAGNLLTRQTSGIANTEVFTYDGLNRLTSSIDLNGSTATMVWDDGADKCTVTQANGLTTVSTYDDAGELLTVSKSGTGLISPDKIKYQYDDLGRLRIVSDATHVKNYYLYDNLGRKVADIADDGSIVEYRYDDRNRLVTTIAYLNKVADTSVLLSGGDPSETVTLADVLPDEASGHADSWTWNVYDDDGRTIQTIDSEGDITDFAYDNMSNLIKTTHWFNTLGSTAVAAMRSTPPTSVQTVTAHAGDDTTRYFYDTENRLVGTLDGNGYLTQTIYDHAGRAVETVAFKNAVPSGHRGDALFSSVLGSLTTSSNDIQTRYFYDDRDLLLFKLDATLHLTQYVYDSAGNLTSAVAYADAIASTSTYTTTYVSQHIPTTHAGQNQTSSNVYDADTGNLAYSVDAGERVTAFTYDTTGNVVATTQYGHIGDIDLSDMAGWVSTYHSSSIDRYTRNVYDAENRLRFSIDAEHYVSRYDYDDSGRMTDQIRYAEKYSSAGIPDYDDMTGWAGTTPDLSAAIETTYDYDADGRIQHVVEDAAGTEPVDTYTQYDAIGRVMQVVVAWNTDDAVKTRYTYDTAGHVLTKTAAYASGDAAVTTYGDYDGLGHAQSVTDPNGKTTQYTFDALGRVLTVTDPNDIVAATYTYDAFGNISTFTDGRNKETDYAYDRLNQRLGTTDALGNETDYQYDAFGNVIKTTDPLGGVVYSFYDNLDRVIGQIDQLRYVTLTSYTSRGDVAQVKRLASPMSGSVTIVAGVMPSGLSFGTGTGDQTTSFDYDKLGRLTQSTDAEGYFEQYGLDAFGNRVDVHAKSSTDATVQGGWTENTYNFRGELLTETVHVDSIKPDGTTEHTIVNTYTYDRRGNRLTMVEDGRRTTTYTYDLLDRLKSTTTQTVSVVTSDDFNTVDTDAHPTTSYTYDDGGNLLEVIDPTLGRTLYYYDDGGRKIGQVDAAGTFTRWTYDDDNNLASVTVYGVPVDVDLGDPMPTPSTSDYRTTTYHYDDIDRLTGTTVSGLRTGSLVDGTGYGDDLLDVTTQNNYYKSINALEQVDGNGSGIWTYYDALGRKVGEIDQDGYLTTYLLDTNGNVTRETRYANAVSTTPTSTTQLGDIGVTADSANDRITVFTYDRNGRRKSEARLNVVAYTVNATSGALTLDGSTSTVAYTYNGLGEVLTKTQATGDSVAYTYDSAGRQTQVLQSAYANVLNSASASVTVQDALSEYYDGLGDLVRTDEFDDQQTTPHLKTTLYVYDDAGRLTGMTDADGNETDYQYDAAGRLIVTSYQRLLSGGSLKPEAQITQYDAAGRVVSQGIAHKAGDDDANPWVLDDTRETSYDAYGEVSSRSINGTVQQTYTYDKAGRLTKLSDEGVITFYLYDKAGHQTLTVTSDGNAIASGTDGSSLGDLGIDDLMKRLTGTTTGAGTFTDDITGTVVTFTAYDARGQAVETAEPDRQLSGMGTGTLTTATIKTSRSYDAFGEVAAEVDGRGYTTTYSYNTMGKLTTQTSTLVTAWDAAGGSASVNPTQNDFYDISGRLVGVQDPDSVLATTAYYNTRMLVAGTGYDGGDALVAEEFHADGGRLRNVYDASGNLVEQIEKVDGTTDRATDYVYDDMNRLTQVTHPLASDGTSHLVDHYTYDNFGRRLTHWNNVLDTGMTPTVIERTDYDGEGRVIATVDFDGYTTTYGYEWVGTGGLSGSGGWRKTTTNPAGLQDVLVQDAEGRAVSETDFGGHGIAYGYDLAGRVASRANDYLPDWEVTLDGNGSMAPNVQGETLTYTYYNTGLLAQEISTYQRVDHDPDRYFAVKDVLQDDYNYDKDGNRTYEDEIHAVKSGTDPVTAVFTERESATFDQLDRMTHMEVSTSSTERYVAGYGELDVDGIDGEPMTVDIKYDANSNIRERVSTYWQLNQDGSWNTTSGMQTETDWYRYDTMNRFLTTKGTLETGTGGAPNYIDGGTSGTDITYDLAGERLTATTSAGGTEHYSYTGDGYLQAVRVGSGTGTLRGTYTYDAMGRTLWEKEYDSDGTTLLYSRHVTGYDADSLVQTDETYTKLSNGKDDNRSSSYYYTIGSGDDEQFLGGVVTAVLTTETAGTDPTTHVGFGYGYLWFDHAVQSVESYDSDTLDEHNAIGNSLLEYDQREALVDANIQDGDPRHVIYTANLQGEITIRDVDAPFSGKTTAPYAQYYYYDGIAMGDVSNDGTSNVDYVSAIAQQRQASVGGLFRGGQNSGTAVGEFNPGYDTINGLSYQSTASAYTVQAGDTLQSIAQAVWGDANFWYLIADANGLDSTSTLVAGQVLAIPNKVANAHNSSTTYDVYDPNAHIGDVSPTQPFRPQTDNGCGVMGQILMAVVAIVVSLMLPEISPVFEGVFGGIAAAGVSNVVSQGVGLATGMEKSFNWGSLGMSVISAGVAAGLDKTGIFGSGFLGQVAEGAVGDAISQGIGVATGLQKSFDWADVAAAGLSQGVTHWVAGKMAFDHPDMNTTGIKFAAGMAGDIVYASSKSLIDGTDFGDNILGGLPSVVGDVLGPSLDNEIGEAQLAPRAIAAIQTGVQQGKISAESGAALLGTLQNGGSLFDFGFLDPTPNPNYNPYNVREASVYWQVVGQWGDSSNAEAIGTQAAVIAQAKADYESMFDGVMQSDPSSDFANELTTTKRAFQAAFASMDAYFYKNIPELVPEGFRRIENNDMASLRKLGAVDETGRNLLDDESEAADFHSFAFVQGEIGSPDAFYIIANRGTSFTGSNMLSNRMQDEGRETVIYDDAMKAADLINATVGNGHNILFTGHSLGGGLASAQAMVTGNPAIVFNPSGLNPITSARYLGVPNNSNEEFYAHAQSLITAFTYPRQWLGELQGTGLVEPVAGDVAELQSTSTIPADSPHNTVFDRHGLDFIVPSLLQYYYLDF